MHEMAWSTDERTLAVVSSHVARAIVVDVAEALSQPEPKHWSWTRSVSLTRQDGKRLPDAGGSSRREKWAYEVWTDELGRGIDCRVCTGPANPGMPGPGLMSRNHGSRPSRTDAGERGLDSGRRVGAHRSAIHRPGGSDMASGPGHGSESGHRQGDVPHAGTSRAPGVRHHAGPGQGTGVERRCRGGVAADHRLVDGCRLRRLRRARGSGHHRRARADRCAGQQRRDRAARLDRGAGPRRVPRRHGDELLRRDSLHAGGAARHAGQGQRLHRQHLVGGRTHLELAAGPVRRLEVRSRSDQRSRRPGSEEPGHPGRRRPARDHQHRHGARHHQRGRCVDLPARPPVRWSVQRVAEESDWSGSSSPARSARSSRATRRASATRSARTRSRFSPGAPR